jgi:Outer membrane protein beta-barrel domain
MRRWIIVAVWPALLVAAVRAEAQRSLWLGVAGGVSVPQGDLGDAVDAGWHALATGELSVPLQPLGLRLDLAYNRFSFSDETLGEDASESVGSATLNGTYRLPMTNSPMSPFLIAGLGAYRARCSDIPTCDGTTRFGWNFGLGTKLFVLGFRSFLEARYHRTSHGELDVHYFPVTFGVQF